VSTFNIHDPKTHFSRLVDAAAAGEVGNRPLQAHGNWVAMG